LLQEDAPRAVVVTGASTGIGKGICQLLTANGFIVFGSVRKEEDGNNLKIQLGERFFPLFFDVTNVQQVQEAAKIVRPANTSAAI
jgi:NADP-dependent 3-hydroxy acid dehydrogenase YdfG